MTYLGNIIDRPDTLTAFLQLHGGAMALALVLAWACAVIIHHHGGK